MTDLQAFKCWDNNETRRLQTNKVIVVIGNRRITLHDWAALHYTYIVNELAQYAGKSGHAAAIMFAADCGSKGVYDQRK